MTTLRDVITKESVHRLHEAFKAGWELAEKDTEAKNVGINFRTFEVVGEPIVRWVHHKLMETARFSPNPPNPEFPYKVMTPITEVFRREGIGNPGPTGKTGSPRIVGDVGRILKYNGLLFNAGFGGQGANLWIKPWDPSIDIKWIDSHWKQQDPRTEKRIAEEADKPVSRRIDLRTFKVPEPTPDKILEFIQNFVPAALKVQDQLTETRQLLLETQNKLIEVEQEAAEQAKVNEWEGVTTTLASLLDGKAESTSKAEVAAK